jgi:hypothetical protein
MTRVQLALLAVILVGSRPGARRMAFSRDPRSAGVMAVGRLRAVRRVALGRQPAVRRRVLRRSCQSGRGECPAGALRPPAEHAVHHFVCRRMPSCGITRRTARRAPRALEDVRKVLTVPGV